MRILFSTCSGANYMAPPQLADEQINCGPFFQNREIAGRVVSLATPKGEYDLAAIAARLPSDQQPDAVVCLVDASWFNQPKNLAAFKCPKVVLVADTHHMNSPIAGMISYLLSQPFDRHVFLYTRHHAEFFREAGLKNLFWFPGLTFPHGDKVVQSVRAAERAPRIALIGQAGNLHKRRQKLAAALASAQLPLVFREAPQREALDFYGSSLIGFNAAANGDLNLRTFEILSSGALLLTDRLSPDSGMESLWKDGREFVGYDDAEELVERARHFTNHPDEARRIGAAGAQWFDTYFNEQRRRAEFQSLVFDGRAAPQFVLPTPQKKWLSLFDNQASHFTAALSAYEHLQQLHSVREDVTILADSTVPAGFKAMCHTLPRLRVVNKLADGQTADCVALSTASALKLSSLEAPRLWCWDTTAEQLPPLTVRFKSAGLLQVGELPFYELPEPAPAVDRLAAEARKQLFNCELNTALDLARRALAANPRSLEGYLVMAELALEAQKPDLFAKMITRARELAPEDPRIPLLELSARTPETRQRPAERLLAIALRHVSGNELLNAKRDVMRALRLDPNLAAAHFWLGHISLALSDLQTDVGQSRDFGLALKSLRTATELAPQRANYWLELASALRRGGLMREAADAFVRGLELQPDYTNGWISLGETLLALDEPDCAAEVLERGLAHAPESAPLQMWLGHARKRQGRLVEALELHCRAHGAPPPAPVPSDRKKRVVFLVQHGPSWPCTDSVWRAFAADPEWEATIVALPYTHPFYNRAQDDTNAIFDFLQKENIPHVSWKDFALEPGCADVLFLQNPYDVTRPAGWKARDLLKVAPRLAYIPYGIEIGGGEKNARHQFDQATQQLAWAVFARSERHREMFAKHCSAGADHVVVTGHPKMDLVRNLAAHRDEELHALTQGRRTIVWNPQFDVRLNGTTFGNGYSTFLRWRDFLVTEFARRQDLALIIRPHPLFFGTLEDRGIFTRGQIDRWLADCAAAGNVFVDRRPSYLPAFEIADAMISDASSFLLEFAGTGRPLLYLHNPHGPALNEDGVFVREYCATAETESEIRRFLDDVAAGRDSRQACRLAAYSEFMHLPPEGCGVAIKAAVESRLAAEQSMLTVGVQVSAENLPALSDREQRCREQGRAFWAACTDTHLAAKAYCAKAAQVLAAEFKALLSSEDRVVDFGCGNGEMTLLAAPYCAEVVGYDLSPVLVSQGNAAARQQRLNNALFKVLDLEEGIPERSADVALCLGVFSCIHDDAVWKRILTQFAGIVRPGGWLVLRDTVSLRQRWTKVYPQGYYACYRQRCDYLAAVAAAGFALERETTLSTSDEGLENSLWILRRSGDLATARHEEIAAATA
jgi:tetratricopeptide (TPR) repeat protein/SAM-dependent methyltransferase